METKTVDSPQALVQLLLPNESQMQQYHPSNIVSWYFRAKVFYDPNTCSCKKKGMNQQTIEQGYSALVNLPEHEKIALRNLAGGNVTLVLNGVTLGTV